MGFLRKLGPGLLYAGAAVGVSHLYQSTAAGAAYGWYFLAFIVLANLLKYPFFMFGPLYAKETGNSLVKGYSKLGKWAPVVFLLLTVSTMFIIEAAVSSLCSGIAMETFGVESLSVPQMAIFVLFFSIVLLYSGGMKFLNGLMKVVMMLLAISTLAAFFLTFAKQGANLPEGAEFTWNASGIMFFIAFMGWMPAPLDISVWHSVWISEGEEGQKKNSLFDFNIGYWATMVLAMFFLGLGALLMYGKVDEIPAGAGAFAKVLISVYTDSIGDWSRPIISIALFTTIFSTVLSCLDAFARILYPVLKEIFPQFILNKTKFFRINLLLVSAGALVILFGVKDMKSLIAFITAISFVIAPLIATMNYMTVKSAGIKIGSAVSVLSLFGFIFLYGFAFLYLYLLIF
jgi:Mn2+/Fe2+ NRAMP family transporter